MNLPTGVLTSHTGFLIGLISQLIWEEFGRALNLVGLKVRHYGVLSALAEEGSHAQRDLGEKLQIDRSTMVGLVDELEGMGLVERQRDRVDRRRYELSPTDAGREALSKAKSIAESVQEDVLAPLDDAQRRQLHEMLTSVLRNLDEGGQDSRARQ